MQLESFHWLSHNGLRKNWFMLSVPITSYGCTREVLQHKRSKRVARGNSSLLSVSVRVFCSGRFCFYFSLVFCNHEGVLRTQLFLSRLLNMGYTLVK